MERFRKGVRKHSMKEAFPEIFGTIVLGLVVGGVIQSIFGTGFFIAFLVVVAFIYFKGRNKGTGSQATDVNSGNSETLYQLSSVPPKPKPLVDVPNPDRSKSPSNSIDLLFDESAGGLEKYTTTRLVLPEGEGEPVRFECSEFQKSIGATTNDLWLFTRWQHHVPVQITTHDNFE